MPCGVVKVVMQSPLAHVESTRYPDAFCAAARGAKGVLVAIRIKAIEIKAAVALRASKALLLVMVMDGKEVWRIQLGSATAEFAFAPEERDVYGEEYTSKPLVPLGAKRCSDTISCEVQSDCAPDGAFD
jgi:hypothetical protein